LQRQDFSLKAGKNRLRFFCRSKDAEHPSAGEQDESLVTQTKNEQS